MTATHYIWDFQSDNLLIETNGNGDTIAEYTNEPGDIGKLISQQRDGQTSYCHFDGQGSTSQLTDAHQNVTDEYTYSAFGETVAKSGTTVNPFGYKGALGYYANDITNDTYVRRRVLEHSIARWMTPDPIRFMYSVNLYCYVYNMPLQLVDPTGLFGCDPTFTLIFKPPNAPASIPWSMRKLPEVVAAMTTYCDEWHCICDPCPAGCEAGCGSQQLKCVLSANFHIFMNADLAFNKLMYGHEQRHIKNYVTAMEDLFSSLRNTFRGAGCLTDCDGAKKLVEMKLSEGYSNMRTKNKEHKYPEPKVGTTPYDPILPIGQQVPYEKAPVCNRKEATKMLSDAQLFDPEDPHFDEKHPCDSTYCWPKCC